MIGIRVDGMQKNGIGMGHIITCSTIAEHLQLLGEDVVFFTKKYKEGINYLKKRRFKIIYLPAYDENIKDEIKLLELHMNNQEIKKLIVDIYNCPKEYDKIKNVKVFKVPLNHRNPKTRIMHPLFALYNRFDKKILGKKTIISMGGYDDKNITYFAAKAASELNLDVTVIIGPGFKNKLRLKNQIKKLKNVKIIKNPKNLAPLLYKADLGIIAGGNTMFEAMCVGLPSLVISQNDHQRKQAEYYDKKHAVFSYGDWDSDISNLKEWLGILIMGFPNPMSFNGKELVDGQGLFRFVEKVMK